jgi:hypothetical protein
MREHGNDHPGKELTKASCDIVATKGRKRKFRATLLKTFNAGNLRLAIFCVPKRGKKSS